MERFGSSSLVCADLVCPIMLLGVIISGYRRYHVREVAVPEVPFPRGLHPGDGDKHLVRVRHCTSNDLVVHLWLPELSVPSTATLCPLSMHSK
jgi:hypothetical protein